MIHSSLPLQFPLATEPDMKGLFLSSVCHARLPKTGSGHGKAAAVSQLLERIRPDLTSSSSHPHCALTQPAQTDRDRGRDNVGCSFTISKKTRSVTRLARISWSVREARAHADGTVTFDTLCILVADCQPCLYLLS